MLKRVSVVLLISLVFSAAAQSAIHFSPSITYLEQSEDDGVNPERDVKMTIIDLRLGYVMDFGLYLGGMYSLHDYDLLTDSSDSYFGPTVGYYNSGFFIAATYYLYGERDLSNGQGKYSDVSGYQVDVSYSVPITETVLLGPQLTFHNIEFGDLQISGASNSVDYKYSGISPYFNLTFIF